MYLAFKGVKFSELFEALKKTNYLYIILGAFFGVYVGSWIRALRWQYLLDP